MKATSLFLFLFYLTFTLALSNKEKDYSPGGQKRNELLKKLGLRPGSGSGSGSKGRQDGHRVNLNDDYMLSELLFFGSLCFKLERS
jgi:hypothetical protein